MYYHMQFDFFSDDTASKRRFRNFVARNQDRIVDIQHVPAREVVEDRGYLSPLYGTRLITTVKLKKDDAETEAIRHLEETQNFTPRSFVVAGHQVQLVGTKGAMVLVT